jgi:uncharacterized protein (DUF1015 family)
MADISAFRGIRYNTQKAGQLENLVAPPYDVLSERDVADLHSRSAYNVAHLTRPLGDDKYEAAARNWTDWRSAGILPEEDLPCLYVYQQRFADPETGLLQPRRMGLVCLLRLEDYSTGTVLPHEETISAHKEDRLRLITATRANFESIYGMYSDPDREIESLITEIADREPVYEEINEVFGGSHKLERISDESLIETLRALFSTKTVMIADGHHRYETSLNYANAVQDDHEARYILITLTALEDEGLLVLPTHRLLNGFDPAIVNALPATLASAGFVVTQCAWDHAPSPGELVLLLDNKSAFSVKLASKVDPADLIDANKSAAWKRLPVTILHKLIIEPYLGVRLRDLATTKLIGYTRDALEARKLVQSRQAQAAFLLPRPAVQDVMNVSAAGDKMPQKSTFFYPKLLSGLIMRDLNVSSLD